MKTVIVLAMHGIPPKDFPFAETTELFSLHARLHHAREEECPALRARFVALDNKMRSWRRTPENDPFLSASQALAAELMQATECEVVLGFNEFCAPSIEQALDQAAEMKPDEVVVVTPMMTSGGEHSEQDIPAAIARARIRHPDVLFRYAWPFDTRRVAAFLAEQVKAYPPKAM